MNQLPIFGYGVFKEIFGYLQVMFIHLRMQLTLKVENENIEWKLNSNVFRIVTEKLGVTNFDLFASRLNTQWPTYASWKPDPGCKVVDAFSFFMD